MKSKKPVRRRAREQQETREIISESFIDPFNNPNPIKRIIKVNQFPWTDKQKDFFRIALNHDTKIVFVNGPAGTSKSLLSVYCGLQLLNMKAISDIMYLRSAVESSDSKLGYLPGTAEDKLRFYNLPFLDKLDELLPATRAEKLEQEVEVLREGLIVSGHEIEGHVACHRPENRGCVDQHSASSRITALSLNTA